MTSNSSGRADRRALHISSVLLPVGPSFCYAPDGRVIEAIVSWEQVGDSEVQDLFYLPSGAERPRELSFDYSEMEVVRRNFALLCETDRLFRWQGVLMGPGTAKFYRIDDRRGDGWTYIIQRGHRSDGLNFPPATALIFADSLKQGGPAPTGVPLDYDELIAILDDPATNWFRGNSNPDVARARWDDFEGSMVATDLCAMQHAVAHAG